MGPPVFSFLRMSAVSVSEWFFLLVCDMLRTEAVQNCTGRASPFVRVRARAWARTKEVYSRFSLYGWQGSRKSISGGGTL